MIAVMGLPAGVLLFVPAQFAYIHRQRAILRVLMAVGTALMAAGLLAMGRELDSLMAGMAASMGIMMAGLAVLITVGEIAPRLPGGSRVVNITSHQRRAGVDASVKKTDNMVEDVIDRVGYFDPGFWFVSLKGRKGFHQVTQRHVKHTTHIGLAGPGDRVRVEFKNNGDLVRFENLTMHEGDGNPSQSIDGDVTAEDRTSNDAIATIFEMLKLRAKIDRRLWNETRNLLPATPALVEVQQLQTTLGIAFEDIPDTLAQALRVESNIGQNDEAGVALRFHLRKMRNTFADHIERRSWPVDQTDDRRGPRGVTRDEGDLSTLFLHLMRIADEDGQAARE